MPHALGKPASGRNSPSGASRCFHSAESFYLWPPPIGLMGSLLGLLFVLPSVGDGPLNSLETDHTALRVFQRCPEHFDDTDLAVGQDEFFDDHDPLSRSEHTFVIAPEFLRLRFRKDVGVGLAEESFEGQPPCIAAPSIG